MIDRLITGIIILAPAYITFLIIRFLFGVFSGPLRPILRPFFAWLPEPWMVNFFTSLIAFIATVGLILAIGTLTQRVLGRKIVTWFEGLVASFPVVGALYNTIKEIFTLFTKKQQYQSVVFVNFPNDRFRSIGFLTRASVNASGRKEYRVFMPTAPNPTSGFLLFCGETEIEFTNYTIDQAFKVILSGGVLNWPGQPNGKSGENLSADKSAG